MKKLLIVCLLLSYAKVNGQAYTAINRKASPYSINATFAPQLFLNNSNVENDGIGPETISTKNTGGIRLGLEIERKSRKNGFVLSFGVTQSWMYQYIKIHYDNLSFWDPSIAEELNELGSFTYRYSATTSYIDLRLTVGYLFPVQILKGWQPIAKIGASLRSYSFSYGKDRNITIEAIKNDTLNIGIISAHGIGFGGGGANQIEMELYAGLIKNIGYKFLKNISVGIEIGRLTPWGEGSNQGNATVYSYYIYDGNKPLSLDKYRSKDFSIGLRLSAGLWYK